MLAALMTVALALGQQTDTQIVVKPGTRLDVNNLAGGIVVKTWTQNTVRIHADHSSHDVIEIGIEPSVLTVKASSRRGSEGVIDYVITAPTWMALNLSGVSSDIEIDGTQAPVTGETVNGAIKCRGGVGRVSLKSVQGAIALQQAKARVEVSTVNESIVLTDVAGDITAETVSGDIRLEGAESASVDLTAVSGDLLYDGTLSDGGRYRFSTHNGDVKIGVPEKTNATVSIATFDGEFNAGFPVSVTGTTKHRFGFTLGTGSARIELETFNGDIKLRRPAALREKDKDEDHDHDHERNHDEED